MYVEEGRGLKAIADALNRDGVPTARGPGWSHIYNRQNGDGGWRDSTVRAILLNPAYAGDMVWNRRTDARFHMIAGGRAVERKHPHGARLVPHDEADWITVLGTHEGLISRKLFDKAKRVRLERPTCEAQLGKSKAVVGGWNRARSRFILSGLVRCSLCGARYQGVTRQKGTPRRDGTKVRTYSYACGGYITKGTSVCQYNPVGQEVLEQAVISAVLEFYRRYEGDDGRERLVAAVRAALGVEAAESLWGKCCHASGQGHPNHLLRRTSNPVMCPRRDNGVHLTGGDTPPRGPHQPQTLRQVQAGPAGATDLRGAAGEVRFIMGLGGRPTTAVIAIVAQSWRVWNERRGSGGAMATANCQRPDANVDRAAA